MSSKVAIVTGASAGIGEATAAALLAHGYRVYAGARRVDRMQPLADAGAVVRSLDVTDEASMTGFVAEVLAAEGRVDVLVNNAGYGSYGALEDVPIDEARRQFEVNVFGLARMTQLVLPTMRAQREGYVVNISSIGGKIWEPLGSWYHATKFAVEGLSDSLRMELKPHGVHVVVIEPGAIATEWRGISAEHALGASGDGPYAAQAAALTRVVLETRWITARGRGQGDRQGRHLGAPEDALRGRPGRQTDHVRPPAAPGPRRGRRHRTALPRGRLCRLTAPGPRDSADVASRISRGRRGRRSRPAGRRPPGRRGPCRPAASSALNVSIGAAAPEQVALQGVHPEGAEQAQLARWSRRPPPRTGARSRGRPRRPPARWTGRPGRRRSSRRTTRSTLTAETGSRLR